MVKPIQSVTEDELGRISQVHVVRVAATDELSSWDVTLHCLATSAPLAHDVLNLDGDDIDGISQYVDYVLARIGLRMLGPLDSSGDPVSRCVGRVEKQPSASK
jgi:hypothetical protein